MNLLLSFDVGCFGIICCLHFEWLLQVEADGPVMFSKPFCNSNGMSTIGIVF